jgi:hypothetical protein
MGSSKLNYESKQELNKIADNNETKLNLIIDAVS